MAASSSNSSKGTTGGRRSTTRFGSTYERMAKRLSETQAFEEVPVLLSANTRVRANAFMNNGTSSKKRTYTDMMALDLMPCVHDTFEGECYNKLRKLERDIDVAMTRRRMFIAQHVTQRLVTYITYLFLFLFLSIFVYVYV